MSSQEDSKKRFIEVASAFVAQWQFLISLRFCSISPFATMMTLLDVFHYKFFLLFFFSVAEIFVFFCRSLWSSNWAWVIRFCYALFTIVIRRKNLMNFHEWSKKRGMMSSMQVKSFYWYFLMDMPGWWKYSAMNRDWWTEIPKVQSLKLNLT